MQGGIQHYGNAMTPTPSHAHEAPAAQPAAEAAAGGGGGGGEAVEEAAAEGAREAASGGGGSGGERTPHWRGSLFVFDRRNTLRFGQPAEDDDEPIGCCSHCSTPSEAFVNCCNVRGAAPRERPPTSSFTHPSHARSAAHRRRPRRLTALPDRPPSRARQVDCNKLHLVCPACLSARCGFCSDGCVAAPRRRPLDLLAATYRAHRAPTQRGANLAVTWSDGPWLEPRRHSAEDGQLDFRAAISATQGPRPGERDPNKLVNFKPHNVPRKAFNADEHLGPIGEGKSSR